MTYGTGTPHGPQNQLQFRSFLVANWSQVPENSAVLTLPHPRLYLFLQNRYAWLAVLPTVHFSAKQDLSLYVFFKDLSARLAVSN